MSTETPYLSLVVTARNDDHGGNPLGRMQAFVSGWIAQAKRHGIPSELILVEWNPPPDRPRLHQVLQWPDDFGPCRVRVIEVPAELHRRYAHAEALALYQMIAKNVGIRRARGQFVLATNIDILFSDELAAFFAARRLGDGRMYRIDRHDAMSDIPAGAPIDEQLEYCRSHLIRINRREGTFAVSPDGSPILSPGDIAAPQAGILFGKGWLPVERYVAQEPFRWAGQLSELLLRQPPDTAAALTLDLEPGPGAGGEPLDLEVIGQGHQTLARVSVDRRSRLRLPLAAPFPEVLTFRVHGGGLPTSRDPRVLNFRVFRLEWSRGSSGGAASLRPIRSRGRIAAVWHAVQHVIDRLAKGGRLVDLTVPVAPRVRRALKQYVEFRGFVGMVRHALPYLERRRTLRAAGVGAPGTDVFQPGAGLLPGARWGILDDYRGENFRRARTGAEIVVSANAPSETELSLVVEPLDAITAEGAHITGGPVELRVVDASGKTTGQHRFAGLSLFRVPLPRVPGSTQVFRLEFEGAAEIKLYYCGFTGPGRASGPGLSQPWGAGWRWDAAAGNMQASGRAELVVTASEQGAGPLFLDLETHGPMAFEIRDGDDHSLASFHSEGRAVHRLNLPLEPGRTHVVSLLAAGPFRAWRCDWTASPRADTPTGPAFLHTNACGDFTLLSRRQWFDLRGYPEFDLFSMNLDSIFCATAHFGGAREEMLDEPMRIYHIEHGSGSGWTPEGQAKLFERIAAKGLKFVDNEEVLIWTAQMGRLGAPMIFNHEDWGLNSVELSETVLPA
jgi:hypothetical protein